MMPPKRLPMGVKHRKPGRKRSMGVGSSFGGSLVMESKGKGASRVSGANPDDEPIHEAFVRAFGVPTNMYRYLARRHRQRPLLLHRSLSYMRPHQQRNENGRIAPSQRRNLEQITTSLTERVKANGTSSVNTIQGSQMCCDLPFNASLTLHFIGLFDSAKEKEWETVEAELDVLVVHNCFDRRKQRSSRLVKTLAVGRPLACNPPGGSILTRGSTSTSSTAESAESAKSVTLLYKELVENTRLSRTEYSQLVVRIRAKERRLYSKVYDSPPSASKRTKRDDRYEVHYRASLPLLHQRGHLELLDGEYEARLEVDPDDASAEAEQLHEREAIGRRTSEWLSLAVPQTAPEMVEFESWPCVRFTAQWQGSRHSCQRTRSHGVNEEEDKGIEEAEVEDKKNGGEATDSKSETTVQSEPMDQSVTEEKKEESNQVAQNRESTGPALTVTYRFVHDGQLRQWSETRDYVCPWCERDCLYAKSLVAHLAACHPRFAFRSHHAPARNHLSLEVTLSRDFDASNDSIGFRRQAAYRSPRIGSGSGINCPPARRLPFTHLVHWKGLMNQNSQPTSASGRPLRVGHQRQYHHTWSCLPIHPNEFELDSEDEESTSWLYQYYQRNIAEFTDVNAGEKRLMTLWNAHLLRHKFLGDGQVGMAAEMFVREQGAVLKHEGLRGNLILHLANLADYGVLRPELIERCVTLFDQQHQQQAESTAPQSNGSSCQV